VQTEGNALRKLNEPAGVAGKGGSEKLVVIKPPVEKLLYDRQSAAFAVSVSVRTIDYALARREFETRRVGGRVLITAASLRRWAAKDHYGPVAQTAESQKKAA